MIVVTNTYLFLIPLIVRMDIQVNTLLNNSYESYDMSYIIDFQNYSGCYRKSETEVVNERPVYYKIDQNGSYTSRKFFYRSGGTGWEVEGLATLSKFDF